ncbi:MAG TPA: hypothetical protein VJZ71_13965 [Phycisphaerae bacterium]|nr:hypothetical protein [Phycisphaerae bacterium]
MSPTVPYFWKPEPIVETMTSGPVPREGAVKRSVAKSENDMVFGSLDPANKALKHE